jgi:uncharacterized membrane protein
VTNNDVIEAIDQYCARLRKMLCKGPSPEIDEIVLEVRSHILERVEAEEKVTEQGLNEILRAVGDPRELAAEYRTQAMLRQASTSRSPWVMLRVTLRWARTGVAGLTAFLAAAIGYGCAAVFFLCAVLKPLFPSRIGLWLAPQHTLSFGYWNGRLTGTEIYGISVRPPASFVLGTLGSTDGPVRELLGVWLIPVGALCAALFFGGTTRIARWLIKGLARRGQRGSPRTPALACETLHVNRRIPLFVDGDRDGPFAHPSLPPGLRIAAAPVVLAHWQSALRSPLMRWLHRISSSLRIGPFCGTINRELP